MVEESSTDKFDDNPWDESVSVLMDNEPSDLDPMNLDMPYGRQVWDQYHLIGDVMRKQELAFQPSEMFYARLSKALEQEPVHQLKRQSLWPWGLSIAASLMLSVGVWLFSQNAMDETLEQAPALVQAPAPSASTPLSASSGVNSMMAARPASSSRIQKSQESAAMAEVASAETAPNKGLYMAFAPDKVAQIKEFVTPGVEQVDLSQFRDFASTDASVDRRSHMTKHMSTAQAQEETLSSRSLAETADSNDQSSHHQTAQAMWQSHFKILIEQHNRSAGTRLTVPVSLRGVIAP